MEEFIDHLFQIRSNCAANRDRLASTHNISIAHSPIYAFGMIYNVATSALEQTSHYHAAWGYPKSVSNDTPDGREKLERLMHTSKTMFIWSMSAIEFSSKDAIINFPGILAPDRSAQSVYFGELIKLSAEQGLIEEAKRPLWFGANKIRNRLVHNNGVASETLVLNFPNSLLVRMTEGQHMEGDMVMFPRLTFWLTQEYAEWCDRFLSRRSQS